MKIPQEKKRLVKSLTQHTSPIAGLRLRPRNETDLVSLADLWVASWQEAMPSIDFRARRPWLIDHLRNLEAAGAVTVCALDGSDKLLGFATFDPAEAYLNQLAVAPEAKGSSAATLLLNEVRRLCSGSLTLDVNQDNSRAVRFYEREGFEKIAEGTNSDSGLKTWRLRFAKSS